MDWEENLMPFADPQQRPAVELCCVCGREIYGIGGQCSYCARFCL